MALGRPPLEASPCSIRPATHVALIEQEDGSGELAVPPRYERREAVQFSSLKVSELSASELRAARSGSGHGQQRHGEPSET